MKGGDPYDSFIFADFALGFIITFLCFLRVSVWLYTDALLFFSEVIMKRLKQILLGMENSETTYKRMYEGPLCVPEDGPDCIYRSPIYYNGEVGFLIENSGKLKQDCPTVTVMIPCELLTDTDLNESTEKALKLAAADCLLREFARFVVPLNEALFNPGRPDKENGRYYIFEPGGEVLARNAAYFEVLPPKYYKNGNGIIVFTLPEKELRAPCLHLCIKLQVQLPYRKIKRTISMLCSELPKAVNAFINGYDRERVFRAMTLAKKQSLIRTWLKTSKYCAFIANGSVLPRSGETQLPLEDALPFKSVPDDEIEVAGIRGMVIRRGVTVITGGGYSGKSTLLDAIAAGIYNHAEGDGRELVITDDTAVTIAAEDGRSVKNTDISPFLGWLPMGADTHSFSTDHASGSTSQAANIIEAVNGGCQLLLIDEDRSATNFMIRDEKMKRLIEREPITPFTDRVRELSCTGVSTILVIGGSGEYLAAADRVYMMDDFVIKDVTSRAKALAGVCTEAIPCKFSTLCRKVEAKGFTSYPEAYGSERLEYSDTGIILLGREYIDTRAIHSLASHAAGNALAFMLRHLMISNAEDIIDINEAVDMLYELIDSEGFDYIWSNRFDNTLRFMELPRKLDVLAAIYRLRGITLV